MRKSLLASAIAAMLLAGASLPTAAQQYAHIVVYNRSDAWGWITAYSSGSIKGAWCVDPGKHSVNSFRVGITRLRVEVTHKNCSHPVMLDASVSRKNSGITATIYGANGKYSWHQNG